jgi:hypothetical protein
MKNNDIDMKPTTNYHPVMQAIHKDMLSHKHKVKMQAPHESPCKCKTNAYQLMLKPNGYGKSRLRTLCVSVIRHFEIDSLRPSVFHVLGVVWTAHKKKRIHGVLLRLILRHQGGRHIQRRRYM